jgi:hypothetical protein
VTEQVLLELARARLAEHPGCPPGPAGETAVRLLDAVGLRHGISPGVWASVTSLPGACLDAIRWRDGRNEYRRQSDPGWRSPVGMTAGPVRLGGELR